MRLWKKKNVFPDKLQKEKTELVGVAWALGCHESQKANVRFEISTFEIWYKRNLVKIRKLILFGPKYLNLAFVLKILEGKMSDLKSSPSK